VPKNSLQLRYYFFYIEHDLVIFGFLKLFTISNIQLMTLIKSISGIRGTIGGAPNDNLTPLDAVKFAAAYGTWIKSRKGKKVVIGRDARPSGEMISCADIK
jgi:phosphomannomutase